MKAIISGITDASFRYSRKALFSRLPVGLQKCIKLLNVHLFCDFPEPSDRFAEDLVCDLRKFPYGKNTHAARL
jgi:hypothetical protein